MNSSTSAKPKVVLCLARKLAEPESQAACVVLSGLRHHSQVITCSPKVIASEAPHGLVIEAGTAADAEALDPLLPRRELGSLAEHGEFESFLRQVHLYRRWILLRSSRISPQALVNFYADNKYLLMAHSPATYQELGPSLARREFLEENGGIRIIGPLMQAIGRPASRGSQANAIQHMQGYLKKQLSRAQKQEFTRTLEAYRAGLLPLSAPLHELRGHLARHPHPYLLRQTLLHADTETEPGLGDGENTCS